VLVINLILVAILSLLNTLEVGLISRIQSVATVLKIMPMVIVAVMFWFYWKTPFTFDFSNITAVGYTLPTAIFGYWGFESCCSISHLIKGGPTKASSVILTAFFIVALLYTTFHFGVMCIMGVPSVELLGATVFPAYMGISSKAVLMAIKVGMGLIFLLAFFNAAYGVMLANIANISSLAHKKVLFGSTLLEKVNRFNRPILPIVLQCAVVWALMTFVPHKEILIALANFGVIIAMVLTITAVARQQFKKKQIVPLAISCAAYASCAVLIFFSWNDLGATMAGRFMALVPLLVGLVAGFGMYCIKKGTCA
jgi:amino acid transporter